MSKVYLKSITLFITLLSIFYMIVHTEAYLGSINQITSTSLHSKLQYLSFKGFYPGKRIFSNLNVALTEENAQVTGSGATSSEKAKIILKITGEHVGNALFRAELKKELTFFRGCAALYKHNGNSKDAEIVAEGKISQLKKFMDWIHGLEVDISLRKPSFQGPRFMINVVDEVWDSFDGKMKGFQSTDEAPSLPQGATDSNSMEAKNMTGTDESV